MRLLWGSQESFKFQNERKDHKNCQMNLGKFEGFFDFEIVCDTPRSTELY